MIYEILPVNNYSGNNSSTTFDFNFYIDDKSQLSVTLIDENQVETVLELDVDYTINEIKNENGSYITFPINGSKYGVLSSEEKISLELTLPISQETQYNNSSLLNLEALEYSFDYLTRLIQIISRKIELCVKVSECSSATPEELLETINTQVSSALSAASNASNILTVIEEEYSEIKSIYEDISSYSDKFETIEEELSNKLSLDLSNLTNDGKSSISDIGYPSTTYISLTLGSSGTSYTAPANGFFYLSKTAGTSSCVHATMASCDSTFTRRGLAYYYPTRVVHIDIPVKKGETVQITYDATGETKAFYFFYAVGSEHEA